MPIPRSRLENVSERDIVLVGIPFDANSSFLRGPAQAPEKIVAAIESDSANFFTESLMDLNENPRLKWVGNIETDEYLAIEHPITEILEQGGIPFSLGGDHSVTFPILRAMHKKYPNLGILHFDSHGDLYDELDGNRYSHACPFARIMEEGLANRLVQVGIRTLTLHQQQQADRFGVEVIDMRSWHPEQTFEFDGPVYVSFDLDVLDPAFVPGVSHHEPGGFTTREVLHIIQALHLDIVGADVVEYNPTRDVHDMTSMVAAKIVKEMVASILISE